MKSESHAVCHHSANPCVAASGVGPMTFPPYSSADEGKTDKSQLASSEKVAMAMKETGRIATTEKVNPPYSLGGANVHRHLIYCSLGPLESSDLYIGFCKA